jgi:hypothetical protein
VRDVRLGRQPRIIIRALVRAHLQKTRREVEIAAQHQHMAEFKVQCELEHQLQRILRALELADAESPSANLPPGNYTTSIDGQVRHNHVVTMHYRVEQA